jgi:hypothetical protein
MILVHFDEKMKGVSGFSIPRKHIAWFRAFFESARLHDGQKSRYVHSLLPLPSFLMKVSIFIRFILIDHCYSIEPGEFAGWAIVTNTSSKGHGSIWFDNAIPICQEATDGSTLCSKETTKFSISRYIGSNVTFTCPGGGELLTEEITLHHPRILQIAIW